MSDDMAQYAREVQSASDSGYKRQQARIEALQAEANAWEAAVVQCGYKVDALQAELDEARAVISEIADQTKGVTPNQENLQMAIGSIHSYARAFLSRPKP